MATETEAEITGRDEYLIAQALWLAIKFNTLIPEEYRQKSNCLDMMEILQKRFPSYVVEFDAQDARAAAVRAGYQPVDGDTFEDVQEFLESLPDTTGSA